jgi:hypothetical protein
MVDVTYSTIETDIQTLVYNLIKNNLSTSANVLDGRPDQLMRGVGFPYILVHSPERGQEEKLTNTLRKIPVTLTIEIFASDKESIVRTLSGEALGILKTNQNTTRDDKVFKYLVNNSALNIDIAENDKKIFSMIMIVGYEVYLFD